MYCIVEGDHIRWNKVRKNKTRNRSTFTMSGIEHWCTGGSGRGGGVNTFGWDACLPCPADWDWSHRGVDVLKAGLFLE